MLHCRWYREECDVGGVGKGVGCAYLWGKCGAGVSGVWKDFLLWVV